jgi:4-amino-4-deoxy-L-arabinose transferase-like glycosyltransferase
MRMVLVVVLAVAAAARLWFLDAGIPHAVGIDEPQVMGRAVTILRTGDWNPHVFDDPTLVIYLHAVAAIGRFLLGAVRGEWTALDAFSVEAIYGTGRLVAASIGVLTVYLTYRLARELTGRREATLAAALLAVHPLHVRESHFILTDVPMTALTTLGVWLAIRAARLHDVRAYAWAGAVCGLAAAAKYNGGISIVAPLAAWAVCEPGRPQRWLKLCAIAGAAAVAFLAGAPYTLLDMPAFLDGFAAQFARFAGRPSLADPPWLLYLKHLSPGWAPAAIPLTLAGMALLLGRADMRRRALPVAAFTVAYFSVIGTHLPVFDRYTLPLAPMVCVLSAIAVMAILGYTQRLAVFKRLAPAAALVAVVLALLLWPPAAVAVQWLDQYKRADTRTIAAEWLKANVPQGARVAVENSGPTYLDAAGFRTVPSQLLLDHPFEWYRTRTDYLMISSVDLSRYGDYLSAGPTVFQIAPTSQRWGPPIVVIRVSTPNSQLPTSK